MRTGTVLIALRAHLLLIAWIASTLAGPPVFGPSNAEPAPLMSIDDGSAGLPVIDEFLGTYENHEYDDEGKNDWHYVTLTRIDPHTLKWTNRAGKSWTLFATRDPEELRVGEDCPYYGDGHRIVKVLRGDDGGPRALLGPGLESYDRGPHSSARAEPHG